MQPRRKAAIVAIDFALSIALVRSHDMTLFAASLHEWRMHVLFEEIPVSRCVWSMTVRTGHRRGGDVDVRLLKGLIFCVVALRAQCLKRLVDQFDLARKVSLMALQAIFFSGVMRPFRFHLLLYSVVAAEAEVRAFCQEK
jgi:hypothetical protein